MSAPLYKICSRSDWEAARKAGALAGTAVDRADGYIHFSTAGQVAQTLDKHYRGATGHVLLTVDPTRLEGEIVWEPARGGEMFPHLYGPMPAAAVVAEHPLDARADGGFDLPRLDGAPGREG